VAQEAAAGHVEQDQALLSSCQHNSSLAPRV
jgi:hypothetical protein